MQHMACKCAEILVRQNSLTNLIHGNYGGQCISSCANRPGVSDLFTTGHQWRHKRCSTTSGQIFRQLIRYRRRSLNRSSMWLRRSSLRSSTDSWLPAISCCVQGGASQPYREETSAWYHRRLFVSTDFEPVGAVEATLTPRCSPADGLFNVLWSSTAATVQFLTETAILQVLPDVLQAVDRGNSAALVLLDLSAAFDTVDHEILLQRLRVTFGILHPWHSSPVISVISAWSNTVCIVRASQIINSPSDVWCASMVSVGSPVIHFVLRRSGVIDWGQRFFAVHTVRPSRYNWNHQWTASWMPKLTRRRRSFVCLFVA